MALTTIDIARVFAAAFRDDRNIRSWANTNFGKPFCIQVGADLRGMPDDTETPFLIILPSGMDSGAQAARNVHTLGIIPGILDEEFVDVDGVKEMRGLVRLSKELVPLLVSAMRDAVPGARLQEYELEFLYSEFPLLGAAIDVTVTESLPIGRRNT